MEHYTRICPQCGNEIKHKSKYNCRDAKSENRLCKSCMHKGKSHREKYGDRYDDITERTRASLKKVKHTWHDKIAASRRKNGTNRISDKQKKWLSENGNFSKTGENHVHIKKILDEQNITYDEYLDRLSDYNRYKREVTILTRRIDVSMLLNVEKRGKCGVDGAYQLDHIVEISEGYVNGVSPSELASIDNLQFIPWQENMKKRKYPNGIHNNKIKNYYDKS
jgi:hypothetical protein